MGKSEGSEGGKLENRNIMIGKKETKLQMRMSGVKGKQ